MMNITNVFAKFLFLLVFIILGSTWTDCLNINMINKRLTPPQTYECFQEPEKDFCE